MISPLLKGDYMKAILWTKYGSPDVLQLREVGKPIPKNNEVLVKIHATTVTMGDCEMRSLKFPLLFSLPMRFYAGLTRPTRIPILGQELAGEIEAVGQDVKRFRKGDQVFGTTSFGFGAYAEYKCLPEDGLVAIKPINMTCGEAAAIPLGGFEALHFLRIANIQRGQKVLINGAGGSIGTIAVQLAKYFGAEVTAVDSSGKLDMLRSMGADRVIDYTQEDFTEREEIYDVIFDVVGKISFSRSNKVLKQNGTYLLANPGSQMVRTLWTRMTSNKKVITQTSNGTIEDLIFLRELIEAGKIKSVIDRCYPLEQIAEAHRYVETGHKKGNVLIAVEHNGK